ncbi:MAG: Hsp20/alpha crystallin family protein [Candidatus Aenigmatarchaeota archaeon]
MVKKKKKVPLWFEDPFERMSRMEEEMRRMMREPFTLRMRLPEAKFFRSFPVDMSETGKELIVRADLPGFEKDEIKLKVTENTIEITAEKKRERKEKGKHFFRQERIYGSARRAMMLPVKINTDKVKASFKKGVLEVIMPKAEVKKKGREVRVE